MLCDAAQEMGGKLFILGGGWSQRVSGGTYTGPANIPCSVSVEGSQFYAFVIGGGASANVTPPACSYANRMRWGKRCTS